MKLVEKRDDEIRVKAGKLVDEICFIEDMLAEIKRYPFISINPKNPAQQKATPAARQYNSLIQQYNNCLKLFFHLSGDMGAGADEITTSPLREWVRGHKEKGK